MAVVSEERVRPSYRPYRAQVERIVSLSPHFVRVSFTCPEFAHFATHQKDQRIKLVFPIDEHCFSELGLNDEESLWDGDWYGKWRSLPDERRHPFRTYTSRIVDQQAQRVDIDFVVHTHDGAPTGPASRWLAQAEAGDEIVIVGPDDRSPQSHLGIDWHPGDATHVLLLGDETAVPAICGILESLPSTVKATAIMEVPSDDDAQAFPAAYGHDVTFIGRNGGVHGSVLEPAAQQWIVENATLLADAAATKPQELEDIDIDAEILWDSPEEQHNSEFYAWIAGESAVIKRLRRTLVTENGVDRKRVAFMGYWREGMAERIG